jgi:hypothetical protein
VHDAMAGVRVMRSNLSRAIALLYLLMIHMYGGAWMRRLSCRGHAGGVILMLTAFMRMVVRRVLVLVVIGVRLMRVFHYTLQFILLPCPVAPVTLRVCECPRATTASCHRL